MKVVVKAGAVIALLAASAACQMLDEGSPTELVEQIDFSGHYNEVSGQTSDGSEITGVAMFKRGNPVGLFCIEVDQTFCSGEFSAVGKPIISGEFSCSNGLTGEYASGRISKAGYLKPIVAAGRLSDGRTGYVTFAPLQQGQLQVPCYLP